MPDRRYYSLRTGKNPQVRLDLRVLKRFFLGLYKQYRDKGYFQEYFGYTCVDAGDVSGELGHDIATYIFVHLRKEDLWPLEDHIEQYSEDDLFDMMEFLYDHVSSPVTGRYHGWNDCGYHYDTFDQPKGQAEFRTEINKLLLDYDSGYELSSAGEIFARADPGLQLLVNASLPQFDPDNIEARVQAAIDKFRRHSSSLSDRRDAVRDLADVLEFLRPRASQYFLTKKDEGDLFNIANNFAIRHHNPEQKGHYDKRIWYSWIFYIYLATIHAAIRVIQDNESKGQVS